MRVCSDKGNHIVLATKRTTKRTTAIITAKKRVHRVFSNKEFDAVYRIIGVKPEKVAETWLNSPIRMTEKVRKELQMIIAVKANKVVAKYEDGTSIEEQKGVTLVGGPEDLATCKNPTLTALNKNAGGESFNTTDKTEIAVLTWDAMVAYEIPVKVAKEKKVKEPKEKKELGEKLGRLDKSQTINLISETNPKRPGSKSFDRFALYEDGMTIEAALAAGVTSGDIHYDTQHGFISLS